MINTALHGLAAQVPVETIDEIWIFPMRKSGQNESMVIVASALVVPTLGAADAESAAAGYAAAADVAITQARDDSRRRIITAHCHSGPKTGRRPPVVSVMEEGIAPAELVARLVEGVMRRLDEELAALTPRAIRIAGDDSRWQALLAEATTV